MYRLHAEALKVERYIRCIDYMRKGSCQILKGFFNGGFTTPPEVHQYSSLLSRYSESCLKQKRIFTSSLSKTKQQKAKKYMLFGSITYLALQFMQQ